MKKRRDCPGTAKRQGICFRPVFLYGGVTVLQNRQNDRLRRRLIVERLEDRTVLSGNVTAALDPVTGLLSIIGDTSDNAIAITQGFGGTTMVIGETETTVNGEATAGFDNVTGIRIQFLDGNDRVDINAINIP